MTLHSMTGYGRGEASKNETSYHAEVKTWNSRYVDVNIKLPHLLASLENRITALVKERIGRGKVDVSINLAGVQNSSRAAKLNPQVLTHYFNMIKEVKKIAATELDGVSLTPAIGIGEVLAWQGVMESGSIADSGATTDVHEEGIVACVINALQEAITCREREGAELCKALKEILGNLQVNVNKIGEIKDELQNELYDMYRKRLDALIVQLGNAGQKVTKALPEDRLLAEVAILADKSDIAEEIARLAAHIKEFQHLLDTGADVGRKLDFLCQEMHREANTISSKVVNIKVSHDILDMKQNIEKLRQQVQNIQ